MFKPQLISRIIDHKKLILMDIPPNSIVTNVCKHYSLEDEVPLGAHGVLLEKSKMDKIYHFDLRRLSFSKD
jgi:hypothetical protein